MVLLDFCSPSTISGAAMLKIKFSIFALKSSKIEEMDLQSGLINKKGFSLIELMLVVAIIGMLTTMGAESFKAMMVQTRTNLAKSQMREMVSFVKARRATDPGQTLIDWVGFVCNQCEFNNTIPMEGQGGPMGDNDSAFTRLQYSESKAPLDPWGHPYSMDVNEHEFGPNDCRYDEFVSAGPDQLMNTADDIAICPPFVFCKPTPFPVGWCMNDPDHT